MGKEALAWFEAAIAAVERIGIAKTLLILIALGAVIQVKKIANGFNKVLATILKHRQEMTRINAKVENNKQKLENALKGRKRRAPTTPRQQRK